MTRELHHYVAVIKAGPGDALVSLDVTYVDENGDEIGTWADNAFAFGYTWRDVAEAIRVGRNRLGIDSDPATSVSPHVDLT